MAVDKKEVERLKDLRKDIKKLKKKGMKIILDLESDDHYHSLAEKYARTDFTNSITWLNDAIDAKIEFMK